MLQEKVQLWVAPGVHCDFKQGHEDVFQHLLEVGQLFLCVVDITLETEKRHLYCSVSFINMHHISLLMQ